MPTEKASTPDHEPLAIVGMAFEFPQGASSADTFWEMIRDGRSACTEFPADRLNIDAFYHPQDNRPTSLPLRRGHFVKEDLAAFDAPFFSITPGEAGCMDPQHRRLLEVAYHALENAGMPIEKCAGSDTCVYTGCFTNDYLSILQQDYEAEQRHAAMGIAPSMLANRISWFFNFKGTSMNLDSACSSSLVALHLACQDLRAGASSMALVGGANFVFHPNFMKMMTDFNFLSKDGRSWSFDDRANGYSRGEGTAILVVKRLEDALRSGDTIRAIVRNTATNQDGRTPGITQPSQDSQVELIQQVFEQTGVDMEPTRFFEAHGTGTPVGDPIEANAIGQAFRNYRTPEDPLYVGAVKSNIGHLEGCSGLAGVIKTVLVLEQGIIPPICGFQTPRRGITEHSPHLAFPKNAIPWSRGTVRRACVNSFGFGGTNAVAILDDAYHFLRARGLHGWHLTHAPQACSLDSQYGTGKSAPTKCERNTEDGSEDHPGQLETTLKLLAWTAADQATAQTMAESHLTYMSHNSLSLDDVTYTLVAKRSKLSWRTCAIVRQEGGSLSHQFISAKPTKATESLRIGFVFTGQGAQYLGMGRELMEFPTFSQSLDQAQEYLGRCGYKTSLRTIIDGSLKTIDIDSPEHSQPVTTCLQIAIVDLLASFGIVPSVVIGHSSGEIAAAYAAGALSMSSAIKVAYHRGKLSSSLTNSSSTHTMMAVGLSKEGVYPYLEEIKRDEGLLNVSIGCINSPKSITLTGDKPQLQTLEARLNKAGVFARQLRVSIAYHSSSMGAIAEEYSQAIGTLESTPERIYCPMISSVSGNIVTAQELREPQYWVRNLVSPVEFERAMSTLMLHSNKAPRNKLGKKASTDLRTTHLIEIGPHSALQGAIQDTLHAFADKNKLTYMPSLKRNQGARTVLMSTAGLLFCAGYPVDMLEINALGATRKMCVSSLPKYPFNHKQSFWNESRLSRNFRFRESPRHDLLGTRSLDWNPQMAQWRNIIRLSEVPWLEDHKINGHVIFPAAAMIAMAVEAMKDLLRGSGHIREVLLEDVSFMHPISFGQHSTNVQVQTTMSSARNPAADSSGSHFRIFVLENNSYIECCNGSIKAFAEKEARKHSTSNTSFAGGNSSSWVQEITNACQLHHHEPYATPTAATGLQYGPCFRNLESVWLGKDGEAMGEINTESWKQDDVMSMASPYAVHPSSLDGLAQLVLPALARMRDDLPTMVPTRLSSLWIDCSDIRLREGNIRAFAQCWIRGYRGGKANIIGTPTDSERPLIYLEGLETAFIESGNTLDLDLDSETPNFRRLCTQLVWKPDVEMLSHDQLLAYCTQSRPQQPHGAFQEYQAILIAIMCFVEDAMRFLLEHREVVLESHLEKYGLWMKYQQQRVQDGQASISDQDLRPYLQDHDRRDRLVRSVEESGDEGMFFMQIGRNLIKILCGEVDPLELMFRDGMANRYYEKVLSSDSHAHPGSAFVDLLCFKNPSMRILEVGGGTGGQTLQLLRSMGSNGVQRLQRYDFTDISSGFFEEAREKFSEYRDIMHFRLCDISIDPSTQSFDPASYDLVVASHVLHATFDIEGSLRNVRKLLKPGGRLLLFETTSPEAIHIGFAFGLLKGWWEPLRHEDRSEHSPCLTARQWDRHLTQTGFSGVEVNIPGQPDPSCQYTSIIISTAVAETHDIGADKPSTRIGLILNKNIQSQCAVAMLFESTLSATHLSFSSFTLEELEQDTDSPDFDLVVFLLELDAIFLDEISQSDYFRLKHALTRSTNCIWATRALWDETEPRQHLADGLGRVLMSEDSTKKFMTIALDGSSELQPQIVHLLSKAIDHSLLSSVETLESNWVVSDGIIEVGRISPLEKMDALIAKTKQPWESREIQLKAGPQVHLQLESPGRVDSVRWKAIDTDPLEQPVAIDEVLVEVRAVAISYSDYLIATGHSDELDLGTACSGVIRLAGSDSGYRPGDRVCMLVPSCIRSHIRIEADAVVLTPDYLSFNAAASMVHPLSTAYHALVHVARLQSGEYVLIHHASNDTGQMAVQLAKSLGANVLATAGSENERQFLCRDLGLPLSSVILDMDSSGPAEVLRNTRGRSVDVFVGPLTSSVHFEFSACLSPVSRVINTSSKHTSIESEPFRIMPANSTFTTVDIDDLLHRKPLLARQILRQAIRAAIETPFQAARPLQQFTPREAQSAFQSFDNGKNVMGARVIEMNPDEVVLAHVHSRPRSIFSSNATYLIAGGLGGLGRSLARWMASRGARNLVLLSRSGPKDDDSKSLLKDLEALNVKVETPRVDIRDMTQLQCELDRLAEFMPPIKGCIQATVALRDNLFENMTYEDWSVGTSSKVTGSWNLHEALPKDLDYFILMSSVNGIFGGRAQANYAAGNTFKDALAQHRITYGQKAVSIDLGLMVDEGVVAENEYLLKSMRRIGHLMDIRQEELTAILEYYCDPELAFPSEAGAQVLVGIEMPWAVLAKGIELHHSIRRPLFSHLFRILPDTKESKSGKQNTEGLDRATAMTKSATLDDSAALVTTWFSGKLAQMLGLAESDIDAAKPMHSYGIDSLVAIDLRNWFRREIGAEMEVFVLLGNESLQQLCAEAARKSRYQPEG
ncbi:lovastatin nonaketide synthase [Xylariaceae sp. FL0804]|nr:lovastatin nonaketide synthase [Xylariaceae sp. FL0804]